jgi:hypothetical protein
MEFLIRIVGHATDNNGNRISHAGSSRDVGIGAGAGRDHGERGRNWGSRSSGRTLRSWNKHSGRVRTVLARRHRPQDFDPLIGLQGHRYLSGIDARDVRNRKDRKYFPEARPYRRNPAKHLNVYFCWKFVEEIQRHTGRVPAWAPSPGIGIRNDHVSSSATTARRSPESPPESALARTPALRSADH